MPILHHTVLEMCIMMTLEICLMGRVFQRAVRFVPIYLYPT